MDGGTNFTVADVARLHNLQVIKATRNNTFCVCPFCGDTRGKFSYSSTKNYYHCWNCDAGGKAIKLHMELTGKNYPDGEDGAKEAAREVFEAINGNSALSTIHRETIESLKVNDEVPKASDDYISEVYYAMLSMLSLRPNHKANLLERGFTESQIEYFRFKSVPTDNIGIARKLIRAGYKLEGVPGFYYDDDQKEWALKVSAPGYFCPVYDKEYKLLLGFQIRLDKPLGSKGKTKYLWFTSVNDNLGCGPGALTTSLVGTKYPNIILVIEGILKATLVYTFLKGYVTVIGVPGTKCLTTIRPFLDRFKVGYVFECFDMDKAIRTDTLDMSNEENVKLRDKTENIAKEAKALRDLIDSETSLDVYPNGLVWDYYDVKDGDTTKRYWKGDYKGLDDFLKDYENRDLFIEYLHKKAKESLELQKFIQGKDQVA